MNILKYEYNISIDSLLLQYIIFLPFPNEKAYEVATIELKDLPAFNPNEDRINVKVFAKNVNGWSTTHKLSLRLTTGLMDQWLSLENTESQKRADQGYCKTPARGFKTGILSFFFYIFLIFCCCLG